MGPRTEDRNCYKSQRIIGNEQVINHMGAFFLNVHLRKSLIMNGAFFEIFFFFKN